MTTAIETSLKQKIQDAVEIPILTRCCCCFPLRKGLIALAYINLTLTVLAACSLSTYIAYIRNSSEAVQTEYASEYARLITDVVILIIDVIMSITFIIALHRKHVLLMKTYLYFLIVFSILGFVYGLAFLTAETASELFLVLFQLTLQIYLADLIWSSIIKMERDGTVKYSREQGPV